jgi:hypothetical protein
VLEERSRFHNKPASTLPILAACIDYSSEPPHPGTRACRPVMTALAGTAADDWEEF